MRINQAIFGACVAAALVFGARAAPAGRAPATPAAPLYEASIRIVHDRVLTAVLDAAGEIKARIRQF